MSIRFLVADHYAQVRQDASFWRPYIEEAFKAQELSLEPILAIEDDGTNANFWLGSNKVLKIYTPFFHGRETKGVETAVLRCLMSAGFPSPRVIARGELMPLDDDWRWPFAVTEKLPGRTLLSLWPDLPFEQKQGFAFQLGDLVRRLHGVVPNSDVSTTYQAAWPKGFADFLKRQHQVVAAKAELAVVPLYEEILRLAPTTLAQGWPTILHGDIDGSHILVNNGQITGLIDFGDAKLGDPLYDFVTIHHDLFDLDPRLFTEFLRGYGMKPQDQKNFHHRLTSYAILHEWPLVDDLPRWAVRSGAHSLGELGEWMWRTW